MLSGPARPGPFLPGSNQAPTGADQRARDALSRTRRASHGVGSAHETPSVVTAATAKTPLQITCPRRSPGAAAVTAKTPKSGLEITADTCALGPGWHPSLRVIGSQGRRVAGRLCVPREVQAGGYRGQTWAFSCGGVVRGSGWCP